MPTKAVYAIYDPETAGLRFVRGDGSFITSDQICFLLTFKGKDRSNLHGRERIHMIELIRLSTGYEHMLRAMPDKISELRDMFPTRRSVRAKLTFVGDGDDLTGLCPALTPLTIHTPSGLDEGIKDRGIPCFKIHADPQWDFSLTLTTQARLTRPHEDMLRPKHDAFIAKYGSKITYMDFKQGLFVLAGLVKAGFSSRALESDAWTADDFVARYAKLEKFCESLQLRDHPNPINWLEAELMNELRLEQQANGGSRLKPWKGMIGDVEIAPIVKWELLEKLQWSTEVCYPRLYEASVSIVLSKM